MAEKPSRNQLSSPVVPAILHWSEQGQPLSAAYGDVYFSRSNGLDEARHVFIQSNGLPERWPKKAGDVFTIAEAGFGTGLNFLATWAQWQIHLATLPDTAPRPQLHFVSVEKHPLTLADLQKTLELWPQFGPQLQPLSEQLIAQYPPPVAGFHRLHFQQDNISLTLIFADAGLAFNQLQGTVDAWYLDGFTPTKNPDIWTPELFRSMARLSKPGTSFSTFTVAGVVRRGLQDAGFVVNKVPGFGLKQDMLSGHLAQPATPEIVDKIWFQPPQPVKADPPQVIIIGAGLAGCHSARALAERGWRVCLIEQQDAIASAASGNAQGVLYAKLPAQPTPASRIHLAGYLHSLRQLHQLQLDSSAWSACGVLQLASSEAERAKQHKFSAAAQYPASLVTAVSATRATQLAGIDIEHPGLFFADAGWVNPPQLCRALVEHPLIELKLKTTVSALQQEVGRWQLLTAEGQIIATTATLIVACAAQARLFSQLASLPLQTIRGQVSHFPAPPGLPLNTVVCGHSYVAPPRQGVLSLGATFDLNDSNPHLSGQSHEDNLNTARDLSPQLAAALNTLPATAPQGRVGFRCTAPDYLPIVGAIADEQAFAEDYAELSHNAKTRLSHPPRHLPGLYVNLAHGSKGLITAPLAAELLASMLNGEPLPLERPLIDALNPARFIIKNLIRKTI